MNPARRRVVERRDLQRSTYELRDASVAQRLTLAGDFWRVGWHWLGGCCLAGGFETAGGWFGWIWRGGEPAVGEVFRLKPGEWRRRLTTRLPGMMAVPV